MINDESDSGGVNLVSGGDLLHVIVQSFRIVVAFLYVKCYSGIRGSDSHVTTMCMLFLL